MAKANPYPEISDAARALNVVGDKWVLVLVRGLVRGPARFVEILNVRCPGISSELLQQRLTMMVNEGLLTRTRFAERPPRVMYELTEAGLGLVPILDALSLWARVFRPDVALDANVAEGDAA